MATVPALDRLALTHPRTGITVGIYPSSDPKYDLQLYRAATTQGTSVPTSSKFSELATLGVINGAAAVSYQDSLPLSKTFWWYKARSVRTNYATPSAFTTAVVSQVGILPTTSPGAIPYSGGSALRPVLVNKTTASYRSSGSSAPGSGSVNPGVARDHWLSAALLRPAASSASFVFSTSLPVSVRANLLGARGGKHQKNVGFLPFQIPPGAWFSGITIGLVRKGAQSTASVSLLMGARNLSSAGLRTLATWTATAGSSPAFVSTSPRFWVQVDKFFLLKVTLDSSGGAAGSSCAQFLGAGITTITGSLDIMPAASP